MADAPITQETPRVQGVLEAGLRGEDSIGTLIGHNNPEEESLQD